MSEPQDRTLTLRNKNCEEENNFLGNHHDFPGILVWQTVDRTVTIIFLLSRHKYFSEEQLHRSVQSPSISNNSDDHILFPILFIFIETHYFISVLVVVRNYSEITLHLKIDSNIKRINIVRVSYHKELFLLSFIFYLLEI